MCSKIIHVIMPVALELVISRIEMNRQRVAPKCNWSKVEYVPDARTTRIQNICLDLNRQASRPM